ncbi:MAG: DUF3145 domain-containing protein [Propionibacteriaceae bacterium]|jgi:hypothetical protein
MSQTRGVFFVHSAPSALCPHIEWAASGAFGMPVRLDWIPQPAERSSYRAEWSWTGPVGSSEKVASALARWDRIRFEVTEEPTLSSEGCRVSYTPRLGLFRAQTGLTGDVVVPEGRLKTALLADALGTKRLGVSVAELLGAPWDDELEPFRYAGDGAPVRWLHQVV